MDLGIRGRAAIVTGGSRGIGRETARTLLEAGARVMICGRTAATLEETRAELHAKTNEAPPQTDEACRTCRPVAVEGRD
jgi:3-oxoacyl-[acyl-carrier protein] reductase